MVKGDLLLFDSMLACLFEGIINNHDGKIERLTVVVLEVPLVLAPNGS